MQTQADVAIAVDRNAAAAASALLRIAELHGKWAAKMPEGVRANLDGETYSGGSFAGLQLPGALMRASTWIESDLTGANLAGAVMDRTDCRQTIFNRVDLTAITADGARWNECWLLRALLGEAKLTECQFGAIHAAESRWQDTQLTRCDFTGAELTGAAFHQARAVDCTFAMAQFDSAQLMNSRFQLCRMVGIQAVNANFSNASLTDCDFSQAFLAQAKLNRADLSRSRFYKANLGDADLRDARMGGCDFSRADLGGARMGNAQLRAADLRGANLRGARELTADQLAQAFTDQSTTLPNGTQGPFMKRSGAERPAR